MARTLAALLVASGLALVSPGASVANSGDITTYAGGPGPYAAIDARRIGMHPAGLAVHGSHLYVADSRHNVVRDVDVSAGTATIVAGTGVPGYRSGDEDAPAAKAMLNEPRGLAVNAAGTVLYIADLRNKRIRVVDLSATTPTIRTFAGNGSTSSPATDDPLSTALSEPRGVAVGPDGSVLIATLVVLRVVNGRIAKVVGGNRRVSEPLDERCRPAPVSGGTSPVVDPCTSDPAQATVSADAVAFGAHGDFFVANSSEVFRVAGARIEKVAGTHGTTCPESVDGGPATASSEASPAVATVLCSPSALSVDAAGDLYIAEAGAHRVRRIDGAAAAVTGYPAAPVTTYAGTGVAGAGGDGGPARAASLTAPGGLAVDAAGKLYVADTGNHLVREVVPGAEPADQLIHTVAGNGRCCLSELGPAGSPKLDVQLDTPSAVATAAAGALLVADTANHRVIEVDSSGTATPVAGTGAAGFGGDDGPAVAASLNSPSGLAVHGDDVYVADSGNNRVRKVDRSGTITTVAGNGVAGPPPQNLRNSTTDTVLGPAGGPPTASTTQDGVAATETTLNHPSGLAVDAAGVVYIADSDDNRIRKVDSAGVITTVAGTGEIGYADGPDATKAKLNRPRGLALDTAGNLYIADLGNNVVRKLTPAGEISTYAGVWQGTQPAVADGPAGSAKLRGPSGVAVDDDGEGDVDVFVGFAPTVDPTPARDNRVRKIGRDATGALVVTTVAGAESEGSEGYAGDGGPASAAQLNLPVAVAVGGGSLFVADAGNNRIRRIELTAPTEVSPGPPAPAASCVPVASPAHPDPAEAPGAWSPAGCMGAARWAHTATRLADGRVLVAGGFGVDPAAPVTGREWLRSTEIYDPRANSWSPGPDMSQARAGHTATLLRDGTVLVTGGLAIGRRDLSSAEIFDPSKRTWTATATMTIARSGHQATLLEGAACKTAVPSSCGMVLVTGGGDTTAELYDPATRSFTATAPTSAVHRLGTATLLNPTSCATATPGSYPCGQVLVAGGVIKDNYPSPSTAAAELFDPASRSWQPVAPLATSRYEHVAAALADGSVLVAGGFVSEANGWTRSAEVFDAASRTWHAVAPTRVPGRADCGAGGAGVDASICNTFTATVIPGAGTVLLAGRGQAEVYNPAKGFRLVGPALENRWSHAAVVLDDGSVLLVGGKARVALGSASGTVPVPSAEIFRPGIEGQPPVITGASALSGRTTGGTRVVLTGVGLDEVNVVTFGSTKARFFRADGPTRLVVAAPVHGKGEADITVTSPDGVFSAPFRFTYLAPDSSAAPSPPVVASVDPAGGATLAPSSVTIAGSGLFSESTTVSFGGVPGTVTFASATELVATAPPHVQGRVPLTVATPAGSSTTRFTYGPGAWNGSRAVLVEARRHHTATLLDPPLCHQPSPPASYPCGKVLVLGGIPDLYAGANPRFLAYGSDGGTLPTPLGSAEMYDPEKDQWVAAGSLVVPRQGHTATLLADGKVLVVGGSSITDVESGSETPAPPGKNGQAAMSTAELYDPATSISVLTGPLHVHRLGHTATLLRDDKVLVTGGWDTGHVHTPVEPVDSNPIVHDQQAYEGDKYAETRGLAWAEVFDPATHLWSETTRMGVARAGHTATVLKDGDVLVVGGRDDNGTAQVRTEIYHPESATWRDGAGLIVGRFDHHAIPLWEHCRVASDECPQVLVAGGLLGEIGNVDGSRPLAASGELYDGKSWGPANSVMRARGGDSAVVLSDGSLLLAGGGTQAYLKYFPSVSSAEVYEPSTRRFVDTAPMHTARGDATATLLDGPACRRPGAPPTYCGSVLEVGGIGEPDDVFGRRVLRSTELYVPAPTVGSVVPTMAPARGGTTAVITGTGFAGASAVRFGDVSVPCPSPACTIRSATELAVEVPSHGPGPVQVGVDNPGGTSAKLVADDASRLVHVGPAGQVTDLVAAHLADDAVALSFSAPDDGTTLAPATRYVVKRSTRPIVDEADFDAAASLCPQSAGTCVVDPGRVVTLTLSGVGRGTHYFSLKAENALGELGPMSAPVSIAVGCADLPPPAPGQVAYPGGRYSLVGLPAGTVVPAASPLYGWFNLGAGGTYSVQPGAAPVEAGHGYWAWFACPTSVAPNGPGASSLAVPLADYHASIVGNPSASSPADVAGFDFGARWDPSANAGAGGYRISGYRQPQRIGVGEAMWAFSYSPSTVVIKAGG